MTKTNEYFLQNASLVQEFIPRNKINNAHKEPVSKLTDTALEANAKKLGSVSTFQDLSVASVPEFIPRGAYTKNISDPVVSDTPLPDSPTLNDELINAYADQSLEDDPSAASVTTYQVLCHCHRFICNFSFYEYRFVGKRQRNRILLHCTFNQY